jgi:hypothetical protein
MAETAVGLVEDSGVAGAVAEALRVSGFPSDDIRVLAQPLGLEVTSPTSTPGVDFDAALAADLRSMGASEEEIDAYVEGIRGGGVLVFATGTSAQAETALSVMQAYDPIEIEEFAGSAPALPGIQVGQIGAHDISSKENRARVKSGEGARVFTW